MKKQQTLGLPRTNVGQLSYNLALKLKNSAARNYSSVDASTSIYEIEKYLGQSITEAQSIIDKNNDLLAAIKQEKNNAI